MATKEIQFYTVSQVDTLLAAIKGTGTGDTISGLKALITTNTNNITAITNSKGKSNGLATLDSSGKVPSSQLPSYVDDVIEYDNKSSFPGTGESGKIYIAKDTNLQYRWSGSDYVEISSSLALGETSSTAFAGNRGKALEDKVANIEATIGSEDESGDTLLNRVSELEVDVGSLNTTLTSLQNTVSSNKTELDGKINTITTNYNAILTRLTNIESKNTSQDTTLGEHTNSIQMLEARAIAMSVNEATGVVTFTYDDGK